MMGSGYETNHSRSITLCEKLKPFIFFCPQEAGKKGKKKTKASRSNLNHLLGFSVQGQGVNRGELDVPQ
jgi:hypothetical protein